MLPPALSAAFASSSSARMFASVSAGAVVVGAGAAAAARAAESAAAVESVFFSLLAQAAIAAHAPAMVRLRAARYMVLSSTDANGERPGISGVSPQAAHV